MTKNKKDMYKEHAGDFKNEAELEEELEDDGLSLNETEKKHFEEDEMN